MTILDQVPSATIRTVTLSDHRAVLKRRLALEKNLVKCLYFGWRMRKARAESYVHRDDDIVLNRVTRALPPIPKRIWIYWDTPRIPTLVRATVARLRALDPDHDLTLLDQHIVRDLVKTDFLDRTDISAAHKSDIVRLELLNRYGGIWIDATCIFSESLGWVHAARRDHAADFIGFYREDASTDPSNPILENWFLCAEPGNRFNAEWLAELRHVHSIGIAAYHAELSTRSDFPELRQKVKRPDYLVAYIASQVVTRRLGDVNMVLRRAESSAYFYQDAVQWNRERVAMTLCRLRAPETPMPVIKLTHSNRYLLPSLIHRRLVRSDSIMGEFVFPLS